MDKAVLMSIQPRWCELIASGKKTIEVRKTKPQIVTPFKVYIYATKSGDRLVLKNDKVFEISKAITGKVIGEFWCSNIDEIYQCNSGWVKEHACISQDEFFDYLGIPRGTHLGYDKKAYAWHISDLVIYDNPRELSEFCTVDNKAIQQCEHREIVGQPEYKTAHNGWIKGSYICNKGEPDWCTKCKTKPITRPPQSWCYVEEGCAVG